MPAMDVLLTLAEVAIAMAGFSSIVVMFKRREADTWLKADANRFHGMILHSMLAVFFSFLPFAIASFGLQTLDVFRWSCLALAAVTCIQIVMISRLELKSSWAIRLYVSIGGLAIVLMLTTSGLGAFAENAAAVYFIGLFWHLFQAGVLFVTLIWIPRSSIR